MTNGVFTLRRLLSRPKLIRQSKHLGLLGDFLGNEGNLGNRGNNVLAC